MKRKSAQGGVGGCLALFGIVWAVLGGVWRLPTDLGPIVGRGSGGVRRLPHAWMSPRGRRTMTTTTTTITIISPKRHRVPTLSGAAALEHTTLG